MDIHHGYARFKLEKSAVDPMINDYLALFTKSKFDGQLRGDLKLNTVLCLDVSGSMSSNMGGGKSRLSLAI